MDAIIIRAGHISWGVLENMEGGNLVHDGKLLLTPSSLIVIWLVGYLSVVQQIFAKYVGSNILRWEGGQFHGSI